MIQDKVFFHDLCELKAKIGDFCFQFTQIMKKYFILEKDRTNRASFLCQKIWEQLTLACLLTFS